MQKMQGKRACVFLEILSCLLPRNNRGQAPQTPYKRSVCVVVGLRDSLRPRDMCGRMPAVIGSVSGCCVGLKGFNM